MDERKRKKECRREKAKEGKEGMREINGRRLGEMWKRMFDELQENER